MPNICFIMYPNLHLFIIIWNNLNLSNEFFGVLFIENHIHTKVTEQMSCLTSATSHIDMLVGLNTKS